MNFSGQLSLHCGLLSLRDLSKPIGISSFDLAESLPKSLQGSLPSIEELESELEIVPDDLRVEGEQEASNPP